MSLGEGAKVDDKKSDTLVKPGELIHLDDYRNPFVFREPRQDDPIEGAADNSGELIANYRHLGMASFGRGGRWFLKRLNNWLEGSTPHLDSKRAYHRMQRIKRDPDLKRRMEAFRSELSGVGRIQASITCEEMPIGLIDDLIIEAIEQMADEGYDFLDFNQHDVEFQERVIRLVKLERLKFLRETFFGRIIALVYKNRMNLH